jgi:arginine decarboxylase
LQEYANDLVFGLQEVCDAAGVAHPTIVTESGRAVVAHHSMLAIDVLGVGEFDVGKAPDKLPDPVSRLVRNLFDTARDISSKNLREAYHDALEYREEALSLFSLGSLSLTERVIAEDIFWAICQRVLKVVREMREAPEEFEGLERALSDTYFCNFSMFQSLPDIWAIDQLFPIMPIHRLAEEPTRRAVLADITCDSDGKIDHFIDRRDVKNVLELHPYSHGEEYYLGVFLAGAYQEILGDLHNLFGNTNTVHVSLAPGGGYQIEHVVTGDTVTDVLKYVSYAREDLMARVRRFAEQAVRTNGMSLEETRSLLRMYEEGLSGYTYLERG